MRTERQFCAQVLEVWFFDLISSFASFEQKCPCCYIEVNYANRANPGALPVARSCWNHRLLCTLRPRRASQPPAEGAGPPACTRPGRQWCMAWAGVRPGGWACSHACSARGPVYKACRSRWRAWRCRLVRGPVRSSGMETGADPARPRRVGPSSPPGWSKAMSRAPFRLPARTRGTPSTISFGEGRPPAPSARGGPGTADRQARPGPPPATRTLVAAEPRV